MRIEVPSSPGAPPVWGFDDLYDAAVLGLLRIRGGGFRIPTDAEEKPWTPWPRREYY
jgi:hypothetical protein